MTTILRCVGRLGLIVVVILVPTAAWSATRILGAARDNSIFESNASNSGGALPAIFSGTNANLSPRRALLGFDIAGEIPAGAQITSVELRLYLGNAPNQDAQDIGLHRLTKEWGEGVAGAGHDAIAMTGMGFPASPGDATWSHAELDSSPWTGDGAEGDYAAEASSTATVSGPIDEPHTWHSTEALVDDVQSWLDFPSTNHGWILINADEQTMRTLKAFYSRDATQDSSGIPDGIDPTWRPTLTVAYESAAPTGDYNGNGIVDAADYVVWRKTLQSTASPAGSGADGDESGMIDEGDFLYWRARFRNAVSDSSSGVMVPEPASAALFFACLPLAWLGKRREKCVTLREGC